MRTIALVAMLVQIGGAIERAAAGSGPVARSWKGAA
jgi:hypothetical protein